MFKLIKYLTTKQKLQALLILAIIGGQIWFELKVPDYMAQITEIIQTGGGQTNEIIRAGVFMLLCTLGSIAGIILSSLLAARIAADLSRRLRDMLYTKVNAFSMEEVSRFSISSLVTRSTNDLTQVQTFFILMLRMMPKVPIIAIGGILKVAGKGAEWTWATVIAVLCGILLIVFSMMFVLPYFRKMQSLIDRLNLSVREKLTGRHVIRAYNSEDYQEQKFEVANEAFAHADRTTNRALSALTPGQGLLASSLLVAIYCIGATLINAAGQADKLGLFSNMVAFSTYMVLIMTAFKYAAKLVPRYPRAAVSAKRVLEVLETDIVLKDGSLTEGKANAKGEIEFKNVSFKYPGVAGYVLEDVSFKVDQGQTVAFIGSTGSGKTTLVNLVMRFFDATKGQVLISGVDVKEYQQQALYNKLGYVSQKAVLFKGSISSNIAFGTNGKRTYNDEDITTAAEISQSTEFIDGNKDGYKAEIAQRGTNISGGQKQRLSIARAVCRRPEIFIFDDSFSALDYKTDRELRNALKKERAGVTNLIVAQRIGTIMNADQIIVLDEGKIVGKGTHKELLQSCRVYKEIAMSQLSEEELAS